MMTLVLDTAVCCHSVDDFAAAARSVWPFQMAGRPEQWILSVQNVYRSITLGWAAIQALLLAPGTLFGNLPRHRRGDYGNVGIENSYISSLAEYDPIPT